MTDHHDITQAQPSVGQIVREVLGRDDARTDLLVERLVGREDNIADAFRVAAIQFGLFPQIVAEVFSQAGFGSQPEPEIREHIRQQFINLVRALQRGEEPPTPNDN